MTQPPNPYTNGTSPISPYGPPLSADAATESGSVQSMSSGDNQAMPGEAGQPMAAPMPTYIPPAPAVSMPGEQASASASSSPQPSLPSASAAPVREKRRGPGWVALIAATLAAAVLASAGTAGTMTLLDNSSHHNSAPAITAAPSPSQKGDTQVISSTGTPADWEAVVKAVNNAVVSIAVRTPEGEAVGSGVIYDEQGHILTNNHVVGTATEIQVTLADGRIFAATLTGTDPATDLAVIALQDPPTDLTVATLGDSDDLVTGQNVMAIGNPLGLSSTATTGIISALDRPVVTTQKAPAPEQDSQGIQGLSGLLGRTQTAPNRVYTNAIQIDAAINPGNSGGPLFDEHGQVIGITSSIASTGGGEGQAGSIGIGFAIPINLATKVADQLIESGTATHAYLGVTVDNGAAQSDGVARAGATITSVESGSPAEEAGLHEGDLVTAIDGKTVSQAAALTGYVRQYSAGDDVTLTIIRDHKSQDVTVKLAERKDS
ncbi:S1C family serine protease [Actinomyces vulturis]|uniref:S1C family serine protease n=1 Tax=Actinomyces vulturis TaxID=1857645 RepID=UPI0009F28967|nr:trypsin-like peptidase domain-containing protein [Actinomyces vulturis]